MNVYVLDKNLNIYDVVDNYTSIIWTSRYFKAGDFELYLPATEKNLNVLRKDYYLCREQDIVDNGAYNNVMIIQNIEITTDVELGNFLTVTGKSLKSIVGRRVVWEQTNLSGTVESGIRRVINENIINPSITSRKINNFILSDAQNFTDAMEVQVTGDNIEEWLEKICTTYGMGWDVFIKDKQFMFYIWKATDRSNNRNKVPPIVFSPEYDNVLSSNYKMSTENYKNVALVAGEGEGTARKTHIVGNAVDLDRYELYVDARDVSTNEGEITASEYDNMLDEKGLEALAETIVTEEFEANIEPGGNYILNEDYFLGDIVQIVNEYGISARARIIEIIDSEDETGRKIIPTYAA